jgi:hypothetical protein
MQSNYFKTLKTAVRAVTVLLFWTSLAAGQQQVNLTAGPTTLSLPDGSSVPMWGYSCGAPVSGSTASCAKANPAAAGWSPVVITVPTGQGLTINLTNNLVFANGNSVPTSLTIVGLLGGGLGTPGGFTAPPDHSTAQTITWPAADATTSATAPVQGPRVRSFGTEVGASATVPLTWTASNLHAGTYLLESGSHPSIQGPMGLYGIVVVTSAPAGTTPGTAYPGVSYNAEIPLVLSEIDPVQNREVDAAVNTSGFDEAQVWSGQPGKCGNPASPNYHTCYPPAVNYSPLYYLINGVSFDKSNAAASLFPTAPATGVSGNVLVRLVNAGLRMHVPSIVGAQTAGNSALNGFQLIAEDGNPLPGTARVQSEVFLAAGKTYDLMINTPAATRALPIFDRQLSLSANATARDGGMLAYISVNGAGLPGVSSFTGATANPDTYNSVIAGQTFTVSDPAKGLIANDVNVYGVQLVPNSAVGGAVTLNTNGTFSFAATASSGSFQYCGNGATSGAACATVTLGAAPIEPASGITVNNDEYTSKVATVLTVKSPGMLANDSDGAGYPLTVATPIVGTTGGVTVTIDPNGGFTATVPSHTGAVDASFTYRAQNSQGTQSAATATVTLHFPAPSNVALTLIDGKTKAAFDGNDDYRWIIEEDRTFYIDPNNTTTLGATVPLSFGMNFHTSYMPVVAQGCTGTRSCENGQQWLNPDTGIHENAVCDIGHGVCRAGDQKTPTFPSDVVLDQTKRYYISVLPGDAANPGHAMGGAQLAYVNGTWQAYSNGAWKSPGEIIVEPMPLPTAKLSVFVFEDDHPLNGEHDAGGGIDTLSPNEPGLGGFNITLFDDVGGSGDAAGQMTYDMAGMPLSNALAGTIDPVTGNDACPIVANPRLGLDPDTGLPGAVSPNGITSMITVCPKFEADGTTLSPLAGQAVVANMPPGRYGVVATPSADRIARGEQWLQTNTLDGGKAHDSFLKVNEPSYFQEFGPAGYHVAIGFAEPNLINARKADVCAAVVAGGGSCDATLTGKITGVHMSRTPDERLYSTGTRDTFAYTQCYVSLGSPDGAEFGFTKCADDGTFSLTGVPRGDWKITVFDQWNDQIVDGISTPVRISSATVDLGDVAVHAWKQNLYTRTFFDKNGDGVSQDDEPGLALVPTNIRYRDGSFSNFNSTDLAGFAGFNEIFPLFNWYVLETDATRYKTTGIHVVNDAGGPVDGSPSCGQPGYPACGNSTIGANLARTMEDNPLPANLRFPGSRYCANADCPAGDSAGGSTGRVDPPYVTSYGWQGFAGQNQFVEFGKQPFAAGENGGIRGHVIYASTRPFDDPALLLQLSWEPGVPKVQINLYQKGTAPDGSSSLKLVDTTFTTSWDDWAQGFRSDGIPNMNCPGQGTNDPFYFSLRNQPSYLDWYNAQHGGPALTPLPNESRYKCYDGMHMWAQLQPAPYDGMYQFPSIAGRDPSSGKPVGGTGSVTGTNCTICVANPIDGSPMLPTGKYVVEVVVPEGYELVKEEDKNILLGDVYVAPVAIQFAGFGNIFIMPDQAAVSASYNANNALIPNTDEGAQPRHEGDTGSVETFWPCVGTARVVPDYNSLFPQAGQNAPFAGAVRNLCDRKEVLLADQMTVLAKFYVFTSAHVAGHYTGIITDDFTSEFDPFSPHFGEKFSPAYLPVSVKDWAGNEISRVYSDQWGIYDGLNYSSFGVNPPDPSGYVPQMMVMCMNDRGSNIAPDPLYQDSYSQFCYELPFMPGQTGYFDTPVIPTTAFAEGYNHPDCAYPDATPAILRVDGDGDGPWVSAAGRTLTITALGDQQVNNYAYSGPDAGTAPFNQKKVTRHYGFGATQGTGSVTIAGVNAPVISWSDQQIRVTVPALTSAQSSCTLAQRTTPASLGQSARCGQLIITAGNGKRSVDTVTVTIAGKPPLRVPANYSTIQAAIDHAAPGDLIMISPGTYSELLIMWKPVRLQGVGAPSVVIDANPHPSGKLDPWRERIVCLFGLGLDGVPASWNSSCGAGLTGFTATKTNPQVDRLPLEATVGWDATLNGNLAEQLQEPTLMGAYEGAAITVLSKGVRFPNGSDPFAADTFPDNTTLLTSDNASGQNCSVFTSNFNCNPSRIDGISITNSSQGGGGIFVHAWAHYLEISNNRIHNNQGTLTGGITVGQGEHPDAYLVGTVNPAPGSCQSERGLPTNTQLPYCFDRNVNVHHNSITVNSSEGDELFSATPSGGGGVTFCTGADNYNFNNNWVCGNLSTGDGGGVAQLGYVWNGSISHNAILFNQSTNPTVPTNGGGVLIMSAPDTDPTCPGEPDQDCPLSFGGVSDGTGPGLKIDANLIMGNAADSGAGGGLRIQGLNGAEIGFFPDGRAVTTGPVGQRHPSRWYQADVTNNIIVNNVAGWDGAGISLQDSIGVNLINNTVASNDSTASSGVLFDSFFAPLASAPHPQTPTCNSGSCDRSVPQPSGLSVAPHSAEFLANLPATIFCPEGHAQGTLTNGSCRQVSYPIVYNDVFWQNRTFHIGVTGLGSNAQNQQNLVALYNAPSSFDGSLGTLVASQGATGDCVAGTTYWDIGVRGDTSPTTPGLGITLTPRSSFLTANYLGNNNSNSDPGLVHQYCNGSRVPPENGGLGFQVPPGTNESNVPVPIFTLQAGATVDEGNNWINMTWGPLSMTHPVNGSTLGNYALSTSSPAVDYIGSSAATYAAAPSTDFFGNPRKTAQNPCVDAGAVDISKGLVCGGAAPSASVTGSGDFGNWAVGTTSNAHNFTVTNTGSSALAGGTFTFGGGSPQPFSRVTTGTFPAGAPNCGTTLAVGASCTIKVVFAPGAAAAFTRSLTVAYTGAVVTGSPVALTGTGVASRATVSITPNPLTITLPTGSITGTGVVTLTNAGAAGGSQITVSNITTSGGSVLTYFFNVGALAGPDNCTGAVLAPGGSCTVTVRFTNVLSTRGVNRNGSITFTDTGAGSPQTSGLVGFATP